MHVCMCVSTFRDNEEAYVSVNGNTCWTRKGITGTQGTQQCGDTRADKTFDTKEESIHVVGCYITLTAAESNTLKVKVWTDLDSRWSDESYAIDNVELKRIRERPVNSGMRNNFDNVLYYEGWNCGSITQCGNLGQICGGFNLKGKGAALEKTYINLEPGTYSVKLDFIKIDSWCVCE